MTDPDDGHAIAASLDPARGELSALSSAEHDLVYVRPTRIRDEQARLRATGCLTRAAVPGDLADHVVTTGEFPRG